MEGLSLLRLVPAWMNLSLLMSTDRVLNFRFLVLLIPHHIGPSKSFSRSKIFLGGRGAGIEPQQPASNERVGLKRYMERSSSFCAPRKLLEVPNLLPALVFSAFMGNTETWWRLTEPCATVE